LPGSYIQDGSAFEAIHTEAPRHRKIKQHNRFLNLHERRIPEQPVCYGPKSRKDIPFQLVYIRRLAFSTNHREGLLMSILFAVNGSARRWVSVLIVSACLIAAACGDSPSSPTSLLAVASVSLDRDTLTGTVETISPAPNGGSSVRLSSNHPALVVPASVTVPGGSSTATFPLSVVAPDNDVDVTVTAESGRVSRTASLRLPGGTFLMFRTEGGTFLQTAGFYAIDSANFQPTISGTRSSITLTLRPFNTALHTLVLQVAAPVGSELVPGLYGAAVPAATSTSPGLLFNPAVVCAELSRQFRVTDIAWGAGGNVDRARVTFEFRCNENSRTVGELRLMTNPWR
jgi:hypothetical protein